MSRFVRNHAAIGLQRGEPDAAVFLHGLDHIAHLVSGGFERRAGDMRPCWQ